MAGSAAGADRRSRGQIETLPSGALRVVVYAGIDPISKKRHYLKETVPAGPRAAAAAEKVRTRLLKQVDDRQAPRTNATSTSCSTATWRCFTSSRPPATGTRA